MKFKKYLVKKVNKFWRQQIRSLCAKWTGCYCCLCTRPPDILSSVSSVMEFLRWWVLKILYGNYCILWKQLMTVRKKSAKIWLSKWIFDELSFHKIQWFSLSMLIFWSIFILFRTHRRRNFTTEMTVILRQRRSYWSSLTTMF